MNSSDNEKKEVYSTGQLPNLEANEEKVNLIKSKTALKFSLVVLRKKKRSKYIA